MSIVAHGWESYGLLRVLFIHGYVCEHEGKLQWHLTDKHRIRRGTQAWKLTPWASGASSEKLTG